MLEAIKYFGNEEAEGSNLLSLAAPAYSEPTTYLFVTRNGDDLVYTTEEELEQFAGEQNGVVIYNVDTLSSAVSVTGVAANTTKILELLNYAKQPEEKEILKRALETSEPDFKGTDRLVLLVAGGTYYYDEDIDHWLKMLPGRLFRSLHSITDFSTFHGTTGTLKALEFIIEHFEQHRPTAQAIYDIVSEYDETYMECLGIVATQSFELERMGQDMADRSLAALKQIHTNQER